jgi:hypothetical protein
MKTKLTTVIIALLLLSNCATIVSKSSYPVTVNSNPQGLVFLVTDTHTGAVVSQGKTPQQVTLKAGAGYFKGATYRFDIKNGSKTIATQELTSTLDGWFLGNIIFGGPLGLLIIDPLTGAMYKLPESVTVGAPTIATIEQNGNMLQIASIDSLAPEQRAKLIKI